MTIKNTLLKINFVLVFILGLYSNAFSDSLSCEKSNYWYAFNHPKLEAANYNDLVQDKDSSINKL